MQKPGLLRAIPAALIGFAVGALIVLGLRSLQSLDPVWDPQVALVVIPFVMTGFFIWGMGGMNPKMSEHGGHGPEDDHAAIVPHQGATNDYAEPDATPMGVMMGQVWRITTYALVLFLAMFAFASLPTGLTLKTVSEAEASTTGIETNTTFLLPLGVGEFQASQLTVFLGFIAVMIVSLVAVAGGLGFLFFFLNRNVKEVQAVNRTDSTADIPDTNRAGRGLVAVLNFPLRLVGAVSGWLARVLKEGLPVFFGQR